MNLAGCFPFFQSIKIQINHCDYENKGIAGRIREMQYEKTYIEHLNLRMTLGNDKTINLNQ